MVPLLSARFSAHQQFGVIEIDLFLDRAHGLGVDLLQGGRREGLSARRWVLLSVEPAI
jgi:hypothetical protein